MKNLKKSGNYLVGDLSDRGIVGRGIDGRGNFRSRNRPDTVCTTNIL